MRDHAAVPGGVLRDWSCYPVPSHGHECVLRYVSGKITFLFYGREAETIGFLSIDEQR